MAKDGYIDTEARWFKILVVVMSILALVFFIAQAVEWNRVRKDKGTSSVSEGTAHFYFWVNVVFAVLFGFLLIWSLIRLFIRRGERYELTVKRPGRKAKDKAKKAASALRSKAKKAASALRSKAKKAAAYLKERAREAGRPAQEWFGEREGGYSRPEADTFASAMRRSGVPRGMKDMGRGMDMRSTRPVSFSGAGKAPASSRDFPPEEEGSEYSTDSGLRVIRASARQEEQRPMFRVRN